MNLRAQWMIYFFMLAIFQNCSTSQPATSSQRPKGERVPLPKTQFLLDDDQDGVFKAVDLMDKPVPLQGTEQWTRDFYTSIRYPATARKKGIKGIVILDVLVDEFGRVNTVEILQGVSKEIDEEAKRAFVQSTKRGYSPLLYQEKNLPFRMHLPVRFNLE